MGEPFFNGPLGGCETGVWVGLVWQGSWMYNCMCMYVDMKYINLEVFFIITWSLYT